MFGYVRPVLNRLCEEDRERYQSAYCGLCHVMGQRYGPVSRFTLNYDFTFLALLMCAEGAVSHQAARCMVHPLRTPKPSLRGAAVELAADESMILTWHKLNDDVQDRSMIAGLPGRAMRGVFQRAYQTAAQARPGFAQAVADGMERLRQLEQARSPQLDRVADAFAGILRSAVEPGMDGGRSRALGELLYHLGRWIYLIDAWDDLDEDCKAGRYNPLDARFQGRAKEERAYVETTLNHSLHRMGAAAQLICFDQWTHVVENVLYYGLPAVQKAVLDGTWNELQRKHKGENDR